MRNRELNQDEYNMVIAIKQGSQETLNDRFQDFWKERCGLEHISQVDTFDILSEFALNRFDRPETSFILDEIKRVSFWDKDKTFSMEDINDLFLRAIRSMRMIYEN